MAFKNQNVSPSIQPGTGPKNDRKPDANMPANNNGTFPVKLGGGQESRVPAKSTRGPAQGGTVAKTAQKANLPTKNKATTPLPLGTTKHPVGGVPGYLRGK